MGETCGDNLRKEIKGHAVREENERCSFASENIFTKNEKEENCFGVVFCKFVNRLF